MPVSVTIRQEFAVTYSHTAKLRRIMPVSVTIRRNFGQDPLGQEARPSSNSVRFSNARRIICAA
jgi:hypothetical protein